MLKRHFLMLKGQFDDETAISEAETAIFYANTAIFYAEMARF